MKFDRVLSSAPPSGVWIIQGVESLIEWKIARSEIVDARSGKVIHEQYGVEVPAQWSDRATDILSQKYFRKAGVPSDTEFAKLADWDGPNWLRPRAVLPGATFGGETSARQVFRRLAGAWTYWGWKHDYFGKIISGGNDAHQEAVQSAEIFYDECFMMLALQYAAPNSPQWFNTGLHWAYGIEGGSDDGQFFVPDREDRFAATLDDVKRTANGYERPQPHACFLTGTEDNLVGENGIMETWSTEARIFKYGSGSGVNVSPWRSRSEKLSGGGVASGVMSWLTIGDKAAGAIQSGGTTRRAAKMVMLDDDHPELVDFIHWKEREEHKAASMHVGSKLIELYARGQLPPELESLVPQQTKDRLRQGLKAEIYGIGYEEEANRTIDGQNSNNSVRVTDAFLSAASVDSLGWDLIERVSGKIAKTVVASDVWNELCTAAWACADPGVIYHDTVNSWNTCAADGTIRTTNPCCEFHHLDWSACNLASLRLSAFLREDGTFDTDLFVHVCRIVTVVLDVSVTMAAFPAPEFAVGAYNYRTLGIGYSDLGGLLMQIGLPYDSDEGRAVAAAITALMTGVSYRISAEMAGELGPFPRWDANADDFLRVMRNHRRALTWPLDSWEQLNIMPYCCVRKDLPLEHNNLLTAALDEWDKVIGAESFRNAQVSLIAPTGTISFSMDCDTTGMEPEFGLVKYKNLAGGGTMRIVNGAVGPALRRLGYDEPFVNAALAKLENPPSGERWVLTDDLRNEHRVVFAGANEITYQAHILMLAAIQPFLSGAASKTINLPEGATVAHVSEAYLMCHKYGIKAVALYRNNSKLAQPLQADEVKKIEPEELITSRVHTVRQEPDGSLAATLARGEREDLPNRTEIGYRQKAKIGDRGREQTVFWHVGCYPDGRVGELFIELAKQGSSMRATNNCTAIAISIGLQHGVPLDKYIEQFIGTKFEPAGFVEGHDEISFASSVMDLIAKDLAITYLGRDDLRRSVPASAIGDPGKIVALDRAAMLIAQGALATGEMCPGCGGELVQTGRCLQCTNCNWNEGCSG